MTLEPVHLRRGVPPDHIRLFILKCPRNNDDNIVFPNPYPLPHLSRYSGIPHGSIQTSDPQVVRPEHHLNRRQNLTIPFAGGAYASYRLHWLLPFTQAQHLYVI